MGTTETGETSGPDLDPWSPPSAFEEYRILQPLGRGAMGQVYLARDTLLDRLVAVKLIATRVPEDDARQDQFLVEARAVARLQHPNVVTIHRVGHVQRQPFLVSEYIRGLPLDRVERPLAWPRVLAIAIDLARGLGEAHRQGIVHRDIKPANVMVTDDGVAKLLDFGVAKLLDLGTVPDAVASPSGREASRSGELVGTPLYAAPEIWRGEPATRRCDVYAFGVLLWELCAGGLPYRELARDDLREMVISARLPALRDAAPAAAPALCAIVDRCVAPDPAERFASGDAVREALEALAAPARAFVAAETPPYRGLQAFDAAHRDLFFARDRDVRGVLERLRGGGFVLVAGDSGVGKSSLLGAGVLPAIAEGALEAGARVVIVRLVPGRHPVAALAGALAPVCRGEAVLADELATAPAAVVRRLQQALGPRDRLVVCIDQLEELITLAAPAEAASLAGLLCELAASATRALRVIAAVRADFLTRVAVLARLRDELPRALYLLDPLDAGAMREAVLGPCRVLGWSLESPAMVDALVDGAGGSAALLQFALAALWQARDPERRRLPAAALEALGGVSGALARHADHVIAHLLPAQRVIARRLLSRLVTAEGTAARRSAAELTAEGTDGGAARRVLEALVQGRLLVATAAPHGDDADYALVHEALITGWGTLRDWLGGEAERRAARQRVERAAAEWERLGRSREALFHRRQLVEVAALAPASLGSREQAFLRRSRSAARRRRALGVLAVAAIALTAAGAYGTQRWIAVRARDRLIALRLGEADAAALQARAREPAIERLRADGFAAFDAGHSDDGEQTWTRVREGERALAADRGHAREALERALVLDGARRDVRRRFAAALLDGALAAERDHRRAEAADLVARLRANDPDGDIAARWEAPAHLELRATPTGTAITMQRYDDEAGHRRLSRPLRDAVDVLDDRTLAPGSYLLSLRAPGRPIMRYPLVLARGEARRIELTVPATVPDGFVYVAPGRFLFGSADDELVRRNLLPAPPLHPVTTGAYLIQRTEVTIRAWLVFLAALPPDERARRRPRARNYFGAVELTQVSDGRWQLAFEQPSKMASYQLAAGQPMHYRDRALRAAQDWLDFPVTGVSFTDALAYVAWLASSGRVPGARLCDEREWERAARGADDRIYPHGDVLEPDDANIDLTYGQHTLAFGPDTVGSHAASDSPFGVADLSGNVWEWMRSSTEPTRPRYGGGSFYQDILSARSNNRLRSDPELRSPLIGMRVCADAHSV